MIVRATVIALAITACGLHVLASEPESKRAPSSATKSTPKPAKRVIHPTTSDLVVILHARVDATHIVATARPEDLRSKEIMIGDGMEVTDVDAFFKQSKVRLAAIPAGTTGVVMDVIEPWTKGNELRAVKVGFTSGPLEGQTWWISDQGVAARKTPEGDRRIERWRALVSSGQRTDARFARTYVSPETPPRRNRDEKPGG